jgi:malic enzyme
MIRSSYCPNSIGFALSNPTDKAECGAEQASTWSRGKALYTGDPAIKYGPIRTTQVVLACSFRVVIKRSSDS